MFATTVRNPTLPGAPPSTSPTNSEWASCSSARFFQTSGEGLRHSGGCLYQSKYAACGQAAPVTMHSRKWTPRALQVARITSGTTSAWRFAKTSTAACMGGRVRQGRPHEGLEVPTGVVLAERTHMEAVQSGIRQNPPGLGGKRPGPWMAGSLAARGPHPGVRPPTARHVRGDGPRRVAVHAPAERGPSPPGWLSALVGTRYKARPSGKCPAPPGWFLSGGGPAKGSPMWGPLCRLPQQAPGP